MEKISYSCELLHLIKLKLHYIEVPPSILLALNNGEEKGKFKQRVLITLNKTIEWQAGIVALGEGKGYITVSKERMKKLGITLYDQVEVTLEKDLSEYGHEFPIELEEVLIQDPEARIRFDQLSPGKQRTLIYYILQVKDSDKRIERSLLFMNNLKRAPEGKETMRILFGKE